MSNNLPSKLKYKINDPVIFSWHGMRCPGVIESIYNDDLYIVKFPKDSFAASQNSHRKIKSWYLTLDLTKKKFIIEI
jgi:hypothetical protein